MGRLGHGVLVEQYNNTEYSIYYVNRSIVFHDKTKEEAARS